MSYGWTAHWFRRAKAYCVLVAGRQVSFPPPSTPAALIFIQPSLAAFYNPQQHFPGPIDLPVKIFAVWLFHAIHSNARNAKTLSRQNWRVFDDFQSK
jgi:hypothetical protein